MNSKVLLVFDILFAFFGVFWAGLVFFRSLSLGFDFFEWVLVFLIMATLCYSLIRKAIELILKKFEYNYKNIAKNRWKD